MLLVSIRDFFQWNLKNRTHVKTFNYQTKKELLVNHYLETAYKISNNAEKIAFSTDFVGTFALLLDMYNYFSGLNGQTIEKACFWIYSTEAAFRGLLNSSAKILRVNFYISTAWVKHGSIRVSANHTSTAAGLSVATAAHRAPHHSWTSPLTALPSPEEAQQQPVPWYGLQMWCVCVWVCVLGHGWVSFTGWILGQEGWGASVTTLFWLTDRQTMSFKDQV